MIEAELAHIAFVDEERIGIFFGHGRGGIGAIVKDGDLSHNSPSSIHVHYVFATFSIMLKGPHLAIHDDKESRCSLARQEQHLTFFEMNGDGLSREPGEFLCAQFSKKRRLFQGCSLFRFHNAYSMTVLTYDSSHSTSCCQSVD